MRKKPAEPAEPPEPPQERGAPSTLAFFEKQEAKARGEVIEAEKRLEKAIAEQIRKPPEKDGEDFNAIVSACQAQLDYAEERHVRLAKAVLNFDKGVRPERREGEKMPVEEAREILAQLLLCVDLAVEQVIIADAQSAAMCDSPSDFHKAHAVNWRAAKDSAIESAKKDGVLPAWLVAP